MDPPTFITPNVDTDNLSPTNNPAVETQPIKRKRLTQACDACRKKKVKCSGDKPSCNNCTRLGTTCTYLPSTRKRGPRVGLVESLEKRLQQMEKLLQPLKEQGIVENADDKKQIKKPRLNKNSEVNDSDIPINPYTPNVFNNSNEQQRQEQSFSQTEFINTFSETSQIEQQAQQEKDSNVDRSNNVTSEDEEEELIFFGNTSTQPGFHPQSEAFIHCNRDPPVKAESSEINEQSSPSESNSSVEDIPVISPIDEIINDNNGLPPADIVQHLVACYFRHIDIQMPMFHEVTFKRQLMQNKVSPFLVYAMCAVSARYSKNKSIVHKFPYMAGQPFANIAISKYLFGTFDAPSVEHVQGLILITKHTYGIGKGQRAWMFTGMAVRMAQELGLHKVDDAETEPLKLNEASFIQKEIKRRTFWTCFRLDRFAACALGRPTLIDEDDCDVRLPCNEIIWNLEHPFESPHIEGFLEKEQIKHDSRLTLTNVGMCACLVSVTALLGRVCQHVNRTRPSNALSSWDPNSQFIALENELDSWYKTLTPSYTYTKERMRNLMSDGTGTTFALIHLLYHSAVVLLNQPNMALLQSGKVEGCYISFMIDSSKRCSEAAKMISSIAADVIQYRCQYMCPFSLYPVFVTTTIHLNNIYSPDFSIAENAKNSLLINDQFMKLLEPYWAMASKLLYLVRQIRTETEKERKDIPFNNEENDSEQGREMTINIDSGLKTYWNRANNNSLVETNNFENISSIIIPEQLLSPRWFNDTQFTGDSWTNFLRSPGPFSPNLLRLMKKENEESNQGNSYDYFSSHELTAYNNSIQAPFVYDGNSMMDMSSDWSTTAGAFPLNRPIKHWTDINGDILNSAIEDTSSIPTSTTVFPSLATTSSDIINIDSLLI